jgi:hypothetical protein
MADDMHMPAIEDKLTTLQAHADFKEDSQISTKFMHIDSTKQQSFLGPI